jgi:hypothetical protein
MSHHAFIADSMAIGNACEGNSGLIEMSRLEPITRPVIPTPHQDIT